LYSHIEALAAESRLTYVEVFMSSALAF